MMIGDWNWKACSKDCVYRETFRRAGVFTREGVVPDERGLGADRFQHAGIQRLRSLDSLGSRRDPNSFG